MGNILFAGCPMKQIMCYLCKTRILEMNTYQDNAIFLNLFNNDTKGLKFLTHDEAGLDFIKYLYKCKRLVLSCRSDMTINDAVYELVRGFLLGPTWVDYQGNTHSFHLSSEECLSYYENTGRHPLNNPLFKRDFEDFRNSIRFRSGRLDLFVRDKLVKEFPRLDIKVPRSLGGADMYILTGRIRNALRLILQSMDELSDFPRVNISFFEDPLENGFLKSTISLTQIGSFPSHPLSRDYSRLSSSHSGTLGTIKKELQGLCDWEIVSRWCDHETPQRWRILGDSSLPEISPAGLADGFSHIISIYHKP